MSRQIQKCFMAQIIFLEKNSKYESLNHLYFSQNFIFWGLLYRVLGSAFSKTFCCRPNMIDIFTQPPPPSYHKEVSYGPADWIFLQVFTREISYLLFLLGTEGTGAVNLDIPYSSHYDIIVSYVKTHGPWFPVKFEILFEIFSLKRRVGQILPTTMENVGFCLLNKKASCSFRLSCECWSN